jgi:ubiquinone/menaquinone biosynthesis C-methylase UbiE
MWDCTTTGFMNGNIPDQTEKNMSRLKQTKNFIEYDLKNNFIIEPQARYNDLKERILDVINLYNPKVLLKAGIGHGDLLLDIVNKHNMYCVVVEPSFSAIKDFMKMNETNSDIEKIKFINGDFHDFPVDYYAADLLICVDYLDFFDSGKCINEFKRAIQFDGIFLIATIVLNSNDIEGVYDDFTKMIFPLHNDYYIAEDLTTFLELKEFKIIKNMNLKYKNNLLEKINYFKDAGFNSADDPLAYIKAHKEDFVNFLNMNENYEISEPYYVGLYTRIKPEK